MPEIMEPLNEKAVIVQVDFLIKEKGSLQLKL